MGGTIRGPVPVRARLLKTFWAAEAQALAKRGENLDRCFIGVSPGGVGQSLYSTFLDAMYGPAHAFFDPNIWYDDQELNRP